MEKSHKPCRKQGHPNARNPKNSLRKQSPSMMERHVRCTDKTKSRVCSPNLESTSDWRRRD